MLRRIKSSHSLPRLFCAKLVGTAGGVTVSGCGSISATRSAQGVYVVTQSAPGGIAVVDNRENQLLHTLSMTTGWNSSTYPVTLTQSDSANPVDGTVNAIRITDSGATAAHGIKANLVGSVAVGTLIRSGVYVKAGTATSVWFGTDTDAAYHGCEINLSTGAIRDQTNLVSASTLNVGNGWWKVEITYQQTTTAQYSFLLALSTGSSGGAPPSYAADGRYVIAYGPFSQVATAQSVFTATGGLPIYSNRLGQSMCVVPCSANVGYQAVVTDYATNGFTITNYNNTTATDGTVYLLGATFGSPHREVIIPTHTVVNSYNKPRLIAIRVSNAGAITQGATDATVSSGGTGIYNLTFKNTFGLEPVGVAISTTVGHRAAITAISRTSVQVTVADSSRNPAASQGFVVFVMGTDGIEPGDGVSRNPVMSSQISPFMSFLNTTKIGSVYNTVIGGSHSVLSSGGTGIATATFNQNAFGPIGLRRLPLVVAGTGVLAKGGVALTSATTSAVTLRPTTEGGSAVDDLIDAIILGFASPDES